MPFCGSDAPFLPRLLVVARAVEVAVALVCSSLDNDGDDAESC